MTRYTYTRAPDGAAPLGLVVLQTDETIEGDLRAMLPPDVPLFVTRVASGDDVTPQSLRAMSGRLTAAAGLLPQAQAFDVIGYGCTSATAQIGAAQVADRISAGAACARVTEPLSALVAACTALDVTTLAFLSPYTADVSDPLRAALGRAGIATPVFGSFNEATEANVVRINEASIIGAACDLATQGGVQAIFLSCTNLRTRGVIDRIEAQSGLPCLSSNQVLAWHMSSRARVPGKLGRCARSPA